MLKKLSILLLALLAVACGSEPESGYTPVPVIEITFKAFKQDGVVLTLKSLNVDEVYGVACTSSAAVPSPAHIVQNGTKAEGKELFIRGLKNDSDYIVYAVGVAGKEYSKVQSLSFTTLSFYPWEVVRDGLLSFADLDLLPGGKTKKTPNTWDSARLLPHVTYVDRNGQEQWLHEAFLYIGSEDAERNRILCIAEGENHSGNKDSWKDFADYWLGECGVNDQLDRTIADAVSRIGQPSFKHKVVMTMPDPIMLEYFYDKQSSTTYWGAVNGRQLNFSNPDDQALAYKWYIDYVREKWRDNTPENLELAGFYILSEILVAKPSGWNYKYKQWDKILPTVSEYLHSLNYTLNWIPYYQADGYDMTKQLGIDYTWIQPNKYWDYPEKKNKKNWSWVFNTMQTYGHGMEIEFEGSHGESGWSQYEPDVPRTSSSILETVRTNNDAQGTKRGAANPQAARNKQLLRDYMNEFKAAGYYGTARIATYSGTNAMYELATSTDAKDKEMYLEYCEFIVNSPLRKQ